MHCSTVLGLNSLHKKQHVTCACYILQWPGNHLLFPVIYPPAVVRGKLPFLDDDMDGF